MGKKFLTPSSGGKAYEGSCGTFCFLSFFQRKEMFFFFMILLVGVDRKKSAKNQTLIQTK